MKCIGPKAFPAAPSLAFDAAAALVLPVFEPWFPEALQARLAAWHCGEWACDVLNARRVLRLLLLQATRPMESFREVLREGWYVWRQADLVAGALPSSAGWAQARQRFPSWGLECLFQHTAFWAVPEERHPLCPEYRLLSGDGVGLPLPRSQANLARFDTGHCQHGSGYYPQAFATWIAQLSSGLFIAQHLGATDQSDATVGPQLLPRTLRPHDLVLGDANWGGYPVLAVIQRAEAFHLCRAPGALQVLDHVHSQSSAQDLDLVLSPAPKTQARWRRQRKEAQQPAPTLN